VAAAASLFAIFLCPPVLESVFFLWSLAGSLLLLLAARRRPAMRGLLFDAAVWLPASVLLSVPVLVLVTAFTPHTIDASLAALDGGVGRGFLSWALRHPVANDVLFTVYDSLPLAMAAAIGTAPQPQRAGQGMLQAAAIALPLYAAFPASGPHFVAIHEGFHNCVPSLHFTWASLAAWYAGPRLRLPLFALAALTAVATLTTGEHYAIDLLAALPLIGFVCWSSGR
jgi:hypothetical protein